MYYSRNHNQEKIFQKEQGKVRNFAFCFLVGGRTMAKKPGSEYPPAGGEYALVEGFFVPVGQDWNCYYQCPFCLKIKFGRKAEWRPCDTQLAYCKQLVCEGCKKARRLEFKSP